MNYKETIESLRCCFGFGVCSDCKAKNMTEEDPLPCKLNCKERLGLHAADLIERLTVENAALREKVPQWISVEDRLPIDRLSKYLVAFRDAGGSIVDMARYFPSDGWTCDNWEVPQNLITHWMPLPEAPEEHNGKENP